MKKIITILLTLIIACNSLFATAPSKGNPPVLPPTATATFTFKLSADTSDAKAYAGFYNTALQAGDTVAQLKELSSKKAISTAIPIDPTTKMWSGISEIYAICGTNWVPEALDFSITMNPLKAAGAPDLGYSVKCTIVNKTGGSSIEQGEPEYHVENFATQGGLVTVDAAGSKVIKGTIQATAGDDPGEGQVYLTGGSNGIVELKFTEMLVNVGNPNDNDFKPTAGSLTTPKILDYEGTWQFQITAN